MNINSSSGINHIALSGQLVQLGALRYTPAGVPVVECELAHESTVMEAQQPRQVRGEVKCVALGAVAQQLQQCSLGQYIEIQGFLAPQSVRNKSLRVHIQTLRHVA